MRFYGNVYDESDSENVFKRDEYRFEYNFGM